ncbi:unnamed protein product [Adineta ricciae]|uniref:Cortactin-binding protein 2 n=1 Tax=Adineta ricciae TaxID=249248 RepID=A0A815D4T4_ADIRI|nr:unnamed protein product [Adineta ricciae]CAF1293709.1 unnamed protein product [Adineta ricciae]
MATTMVTSTPTKEKKKHSSPNKQNRSAGAGTLKRNPKYEMKKDELIQLLGRFEAELQAKDIALAALKSEKVKALLSNARFGRLSCQTDPYSALLRDSEHIKEDVLNEQIPMKNAYETQLVQLEELIIQQRKQVQTLKIALDNAEKTCTLLVRDLENEKKEKCRLQTLQSQLVLIQEEKIQLRNEINYVKSHNQELEQQLSQVMKLLEHEHERHKRFVVLLLNERKIENEQYKEQIKQLSNNRLNDDSQRETKFKELESENERNKQVLTARITQLQNEIDLLVKEKQQQQTSPPVLPPLPLDNISSPDSEVVELASKPQHKPRQVSSTVPVTEPSAPNPNEKPSSTPGGIRRPTIIPAPSSKNGTSSLAKPSVAPPSIPARTQQTSSMTNSTSSIPEVPSSPTPAVAKRNAIPTRAVSNVPQSPLMSNLRSSPSNSQSSTSSSLTSFSASTTSNVSRAGGIPRLTKTSNQIVKPTTKAAGSAKRPGQTNLSSEHKIDDLQTLLELIHTVAENRLTSPTDIADIPLYTDKSNLNPTSSLTSTSLSSTTTATSSSSSSSLSSHSDVILFRTAENGDTEQLLKFLKLGSNPNSQMLDGNTCLHLAAANGHIESIRHLLKFGANPSMENNLGLTPWNNLSRLNEINELECLQLITEMSETLPPVDLIFDAVEHNRTSTFGYLLSILHDYVKDDPSYVSRLLRTALRSSNTYFLESSFAIITIQDFIKCFDPNSFISNECLALLATLHDEEANSKPTNLVVRIISPNRERQYSYAIGTISVTIELTWLELERICIKLFLDHITQIDTPFDYVKSSIGCTANHIDTLSLGLTKWHYQDSPNEDSPSPYTAAREQDSILIQLKGIESNATESLSYNYFIPSQNLKNFIRFIEQNSYVGVYGAAYLQKKSLFQDLTKYLERSLSISASPKYKVVRYEFESVASLDDCIEELVAQDFFRLNPWLNDQQSSTKYLLFLANIQNSVGTDILNLLLNCEAISDTCQQLCYTKENDPKSTISYYFPSVFHVFVTMSKRTWSTEHEVYKKFKWIPFKIDSVPWNGLLKRHLWRRMIDTNVCESRPVDNELIKTLQWVTNVWQRYNECLQKLSLQDALLGPALFFDCPMERDAVFDWLQTKWNTIVAPLVRELSMNKCAQPKPKSSSSATAAATAIASSLRANSLEISTPYESVACTALYVLLHRAVSRDCPLTGQEREQYLLNFVGSRLEGGGSTSMMSSAASSRASTPQPSNPNEFISIQLE